MIIKNTMFCQVLKLFLFINWKFISRVRFKHVENIKRNMLMWLHAISKREFQRCFNQWKTHWNECVKCQGGYSEKGFIWYSFVLLNTSLKFWYFFSIPHKYHSLLSSWKFINIWGEIKKILIESRINRLWRR